MRFNGGLLYQRRLARDMSRADLATEVRKVSGGEIKASERGVRGWEKGEYVPGGETLVAIANALGCDTRDLCSANGSAAALDEDDEEAEPVLFGAALQRMFDASMNRAAKQAVADYIASQAVKS